MKLEKKVELTIPEWEEVEGMADKLYFTKEDYDLAIIAEFDNYIFEIEKAFDETPKRFDFSIIDTNTDRKVCKSKYGKYEFDLMCQAIQQLFLKGQYVEKV